MILRSFMTSLVALTALAGCQSGHEDSGESTTGVGEEVSLAAKSEMSVLESTYYQREADPPTQVEIIPDSSRSDYSVALIPQDNSEYQFVVVLLNPRYQTGIISFPADNFIISQTDLEFLQNSRLADSELIGLIRNFHTDQAHDNN